MTARPWRDTGAGMVLIVILFALVLLAALGWLLWRRGERGRPLTPGELAAARGVFGEAIAWERVRIVPRPFLPGQPRHVAVSPLGHVHFHRADCLDDFSRDWANMAWLIHELTHVWQYQTGVPVILRGLWERRYRYGALVPGKPLRRYGIEQQAAIVEDWFRLSRGVASWRGTGDAAAYRAALPFSPG